MQRWKVFDRARLVAEVAPRLYGHHPASWTGWSTGSSPPSWSSPLAGVGRVREQAYAATAVLSTEHTIADTEASS
jgi:hypothetical protein